MYRSVKYSTIEKKNYSEYFMILISILLVNVNKIP